jgi:predicted ATPase
MVLVGPNGAGKTNFVQALELLGAILERGSTDPIRELGYDQLIRREKKPARAGLALSATLSATTFALTPMRPTARSAEFVDEPVEIDVRFVVKGSTRVDDLGTVVQELKLRTASGSFLIRLDGARVSTEFKGDEKLWWTIRMCLPGLVRRESVPKELGPALQQDAEESVGEFPEGWLFVPRLLPRRLARQVQVARLRLDASTLRRDASASDRHVALIGPAGEGLAAAVDRLRGHAPEPSLEFRQLLVQLAEVYPRIQDIVPERVQPGRLVLTFKERGITDQLGQTNVSDGVLHALGFLLAVNRHQKASSILAIEEPENAIHPWPLRRIIERTQRTKQGTLIITTHSPTVVNALTSPDSLFVVDQTDDAGTQIVPATSKEAALDSILKESGQRLGDLWVEGGLGGVPGGA